MVGEGSWNREQLESTFHTYPGWHVLESRFSPITFSSPKDYFGARTVCTDSLGIGCVVGFERNLDFFDGCKGSGSEWQFDQINAVCGSSFDDVLDLGRIIGCVGILGLGSAQNMCTAKEKDTQDVQKVHDNDEIENV